MEEQVLQLLAQTQSAEQAPRKQAEIQLKGLELNEAFPLSLCSIASHTSVPPILRQSALLYLKTFVLVNWSPLLDDFEGDVMVSVNVKAQIREILLKIATSEDPADDRRVKAAASYVVSKIGSADSPDEWPSLLPTLLHMISTGTALKVHGALKVLGEFVEEGLDEDQFFAVARDLVKVLYDISVDQGRKPVLRALAVSVFRSCLAILEMVKDSYRAAVKAFADEALAAWLPFSLEILRIALPELPTKDEDTTEGGPQQDWRGAIALKLQVMKTLMKIRVVFPNTLSPHTPALFAATWHELSCSLEHYRALYLIDDRQGRLEDADGLPYTLDFLVLEELDFLQACLRAPPVRKELARELNQAQVALAGGLPASTWLVDFMNVAVAFAQITTEEEGLWDIDVNVFLSEETSITANYTPRTACGDLVVRLGEWLKALTTQSLLIYSRAIFRDSSSSWKHKEAALFVLNQLLSDYQDIERIIEPELSRDFAEFVRFAMQQEDAFLRARGYLVAGVLTRTSTDAMHELGQAFMLQSLQAIAEDPSDVVKVSCIRVLQDYLVALPRAVMQPLQEAIAQALAGFLATQDTDDLCDSEDLLVTLVETLRDTIHIDTTICFAPGSMVLDLLFTLASRSPTNFQISVLVNETFIDISASSSSNVADYTRLCEKVLPTLGGAFDVSDLTGEPALSVVAAEILAVLLEHALTPLPAGFVAATLPKLHRILMTTTDSDLLAAATESVKYILQHDAAQLLDWREPQSNKSGLEICLLIIDRLLQEESLPGSAAAQVGGLAAELVQQAAGANMGSFLLEMLQLLRAVAVRLATAEPPAFIQSLILVFARLSLLSAKDVVDFLAQAQIGSESALTVVMRKWVDHSVNFAGYEEIRQNVVALSNLFALHDPRLQQMFVKGDLIITTTGAHRIMTRSRAKIHPDEFMQIPLPLKIIKILALELTSTYERMPSLTSNKNTSDHPSSIPTLTAKHLSAAQFASANDPIPPHLSQVLGASPHLDNTRECEDHDDGDGDEEADWEDDPNDLNLPISKNDLLRYGGVPQSDADSNSGSSDNDDDWFGTSISRAKAGARDREQRDETQAYLIEWFRQTVQSDPQAWQVLIDQPGGLTNTEKSKLESVLCGLGP